MNDGHDKIVEFPIAVRTLLDASMRERRLVRVEREDLDGSWIDAFVLGRSEKLVLLYRVGNDISFDGYEINRLQDITAVEDPAPNAEFVIDALKLRNQMPGKTPEVDLTSVASAIRTIGEKWPLLTLYREDMEQDICFVGKPLEVSDLHAVLKKIDPDAVWIQEPDRFKVRDITRIDFGTRYEQALWQVANARAARQN